MLKFISSITLTAWLLGATAGWASDVNYTGIWRFSSYNYYTNCGAAPQDHTSIAEITQREDQLYSFADGNTYSGTVSGNTGVLTRSYPEEGGTTEETITVTLTSANQGNGNLYWLWTDGYYYCEGVSDISITRVAGEPNRNITGMWQYATTNTWSEGCEQEPGEVGVTAVSQNGSAFTYIDQYGIHTGRVNGDSYFCTISYYEDGGITTQTVYFDMLSETQAAGTVVWKWSDGYSQCLGGSDLALVKSTQAPAYDASGAWNFQATNAWQSYSGCPDLPASGDAVITQDGTEFRLSGYHGIQSGFLTGDTYISFLSYPADSGTVTEVVAFELSAGGQGTDSGFALRHWSDGTSACYSGNDLSLTKTPLANTRPDQPALLSPANGAAALSTMPSLQAGVFSDPDSGDGHQLSEWQISQTAEFLSTVFENITDDHLTELTVPQFALKGGTTYYWRVRYYDTRESASVWSSSRSFQTAEDLNDGNGNGIPDDQEVGASVDVDGNGTPDISQNDIRSIQTVVGSGALGVSRKNTTGVLSINAVESVDPDSISPIARPYGMDHGLLAVNLSVFKPVDGAVYTVYLPQAAPTGAGWFVYDPVNGWVDYTDFATFSADRKSVTLRIKDWGYGDADGTPNGDVVDPGGIGFVSYLKGTVTDAASDLPIEGARIRIEVGAENVDLKAMAGGVYLSPIVPGSYIVSASAQGYRRRSFSDVAIGNAETKNLNFPLEQLLCDLNDSGDTDMADAIICLKVLSNMSDQVTFGPEADTDKDGKLGLEELIYILQSLSQLR